MRAGDGGVTAEDGMRPDDGWSRTREASPAEGPPRSGVAPGPDGSDLDPTVLLEEMVGRGASDLHLTVGERPRMRVDGAVTEAEAGPALSPDDTAAVARRLLSEEQWARFRRERDLDFSFDLPGLARFRGNVFFQRGHVALAIRAVPLEIRSFEELGVPPVAARFAERPRGLVLVTGPTGSGKSTTLATMVDKINRERAAHVVTIEDPIEFRHDHKRSIVSQREVGDDTRSFATALRHVLRQDPDVVLIGEMRDRETIQSALTVSETGHLCLATLHTNSAAESVHRIIDVFPPHRQEQVRHQLAFVLEGVLSQALLPRASGSGRVLATEVLLATPAVRSLIRDDKLHQLESVLQTGRKHGMHTLNESLYRLYVRGEVTLEECLRVSGDPGDLRRMVGEREAAAMERRA